MKNENIVLIGMPSSGKSTVGKILADKLGLEFADTDLLIFEKEKRPLKDIVNSEGYQRFLDIQDELVAGLKLTKHIIATGGSVIYRCRSMQHLKNHGIIVYLETEYNEVVSRITSDRRLARSESQSIEDIYNERKALYEKYADAFINCTGKDTEDIASEIMSEIEKYN